MCSNRRAIAAAKQAAVSAIVLALLATCGAGEARAEATTDLAAGGGFITSGSEAALFVPLGLRVVGQLPIDLLGSLGVFYQSLGDGELGIGTRVALGGRFGALTIAAGLQLRIRTSFFNEVALQPAGLSARLSMGQVDWLLQYRASVYAPSLADVFFAGIDVESRELRARLVVGVGVFDPRLQDDRLVGAKAELVGWFDDVHVGVSARLGDDGRRVGGSLQLVFGLDGKGTTTAPRLPESETRRLARPGDDGSSAAARQAKADAGIARPRVPMPPVTHVLAAGRVFEQRLGTLRTDLPAPATPVVSACVVDEQVHASGVVWSHLTCAPELPADAPVGWRTGCYVTRPSGIWRLARCPTADDSPSGLPSLIIPGHAKDVGWRFHAWHGGQLVARELRIGGGVVRAVCQHLDTDRPEERCYVAGAGLVWSARRWSPFAGPRRPKDPPRPPERALQIRVAGSAAIDPPKHLAFREASSATCEVDPACHELGLCSRRGGLCVATSRADCAAARVCRAHGRCAAYAGACLAGAEADCRRSFDCQRWGRCALVGRRCVAPRATPVRPRPAPPGP